MRLSFSLVISFVLFLSCNQQELKEPVEYVGPLRELEKVEMFHTENDRIKVKVLADVFYEFKNGDREFPKGVYMEFYDIKEELESTLKANHAYFFKDQNLWRARGKVEIKNIIKNEQLNTEELFWKPAQKDIYTEKFVTIRLQRDVIYGEGLEAKQDLSDYTIKNVTGTLEVSEEETQ